MPISIPDDRTVSGVGLKPTLEFGLPEIGDLDGSWIPGGRRRWPAGSPGHYVRFHRCIKSNAPGLHRNPKGAKRGEAVPLMARTGPYDLAFRGKGGNGPRCGGGAAFDPGFGFFNFVSTGLAAPTTCSLLFVFYLYGVPECSKNRGASVPECSKNRGAGVYPNARGKLPWITGICGKIATGSLRSNF